MEWFFLQACRKDVPPQRPDEHVTLGQQGVFVLNEGNFTFGNAKISYHNIAEGSTITDLYGQTNGSGLGDVLQSMYVMAERAYLVVNNSAKIEVCDPINLGHLATISGFISPRYFLPVSNSKAYITDLYANKIWIVNLSSNTITGSIPLSGWAEQMEEVYGKVFVTNYEKEKVYVIDSGTDQLVDSIAVTFGGNSIKEDNNGKLWVLCSGKSSASISAALYKIDPVTRTVEQSFTLPGAPSRLCTNGTADTLYFLNTGVFRFTSSAGAISPMALINQGSYNFYGLGVHPRSGDVYVADAVDYIQAGNVLVYQSNGSFKKQFTTAVIPSDFWFE